MKRTVNLLAVFGLALVGASCGSEEQSAQSTVSTTNVTTANTTTTTTTTRTSTTATTMPSVATITVAPTGLAALLLTASDVGEGWNTNTELSIADLGSLAESPCQDTAINPTIVERLRPTTGVIFEPADGSMRGIQELLLIGETSRLAADLDAVFGAFESCFGTESTTPDGEKITEQNFDIPAVGDQRMAAAVTVLEPPDFQRTWRGHAAMVRVGGVAMLLNQFEILESPDTEPMMTDAAFVELLQHAVAKLAG